MKLRKIVSVLGDHAGLPMAWPIAWPMARTRNESYKSVSKDLRKK